MNNYKKLRKQHNTLKQKLRKHPISYVKKVRKFDFFYIFYSNFIFSPYLCGVKYDTSIKNSTLI